MNHSVFGEAAIELNFTLEKWCLWQIDQPPVDPWPGGEILPYHEGLADAGFLPLMQRRRLTPLARAALAVAWHCREEHEQLPAVFCSDHGESQAYFAMLNHLAGAEQLSPSQFSLSVHNAIAGLYSLYSASKAPYVALAGGQESLFAAFLEVAGMLAENPATAVLVVWYEQPLPQVYGAYAPSPKAPLALAMRLSCGNQGLTLRLTRHADEGKMSPTHPLEAFSQAVSVGLRQARHPLERSCWRWELLDE